MSFELFIETQNGKISAGQLDFENNQSFREGGFEINTVVKKIGDCIRADIRAEG